MLPFDAACAEQFGELRGVLKQPGWAANPIDLQIAAVALTHNLALVTHKTKDLQAIPGLTLEDC